MTREKRKHLLHMVENRFADYLKTEDKYIEPDKTTCPKCGKEVKIVANSKWKCADCNLQGDVVDYAMALKNLESKDEAIKTVCRALKIPTYDMEVVSADEVMDMQFESNPMLIDQLMGKGLHILAGTSKIGKSWMALDFVCKVSRGEEVWGLKTQKSDVLYLCLEDNYPRIQERLMSVTNGEYGNIDFVTSTPYTGDELLEEISDYLAIHPAVRFVVIDTFQKMRDDTPSNNQFAKDYKDICAIKAVADRFEITILLIHHTRKEESEDPFGELSGTMAINAGADTTMILKRRSINDPSGTLYFRGRDVMEQSFELRFDKDATRWEFVSRSNEDTFKKKEPLLELIDQLLREKGGFSGTATELYQALSELGEVPVKTASLLTRSLNVLTTRLSEDYNICYVYYRSSTARTINLKRITTDSDACDSNDANDGNDSPEGSGGADDGNDLEDNDNYDDSDGYDAIESTVGSNSNDRRKSIDGIHDDDTFDEEESERQIRELNKWLDADFPTHM